MNTSRDIMNMIRAADFSGSGFIEDLLGLGDGVLFELNPTRCFGIRGSGLRGVGIKVSLCQGENLLGLGTKALLEGLDPPVMTVLSGRDCRIVFQIAYNDCLIRP